MTTPTPPPGSEPNDEDDRPRKPVPSEPPRRKVLNTADLSGGGALTVTVVTDPVGTPADVLDVDRGFTVSGTVDLPTWLAGTATVCIWADEQGGSREYRLSPCAEIMLVPEPPGSAKFKRYSWSASFGAGALPDPTHGSQIYH